VTPSQRIRLWTPVLCYFAAIYLVSGQRVPGGTGPGWDKLLHAAAYWVAGMLALRASHGAWASPRLGATLLALSVVIGYGGFDETHQSWVPGRDASVADWLADVVGATLAVPSSSWLARRRTSRAG
jgi:VanZ family protein